MCFNHRIFRQYFIRRPWYLKTCDLQFHSGKNQNLIATSNIAHFKIKTDFTLTKDDDTKLKNIPNPSKSGR